MKPFLLCGLPPLTHTRGEYWVLTAYRCAYLAPHPHARRVCFTRRSWPGIDPWPAFAWQTCLTGTTAVDDQGGSDLCGTDIYLRPQYALPGDLDQALTHDLLSHGKPAWPERPLEMIPLYKPCIFCAKTMHQHQPQALLTLWQGACYLREPIAGKAMRHLKDIYAI